MTKKVSLILDRKTLLKKEELEIKKVDLGKGEIVFVRQMTGRERDTFEQSLLKKIEKPGMAVAYEQSLTDFRAKLAVCTLCDQDGKSLLRPDDFELLSQNMSAYRLEQIVNAAQSINAISEADKAALVINFVYVKN